MVMLSNFQMELQFNLIPIRDWNVIIDEIEQVLWIAI